VSKRTVRRSKRYPRRGITSEALTAAIREAFSSDAAVNYIRDRVYADNPFLGLVQEIDALKRDVRDAIYAPGWGR
jgi:hypothetical protein